MQIKVKSLPYILVVWKEPVSLKCQKEINQLKIKDMKNQFIELIKNFGEFNNWKGYVDQYFNIKNQRELKKLGVYKDMKILDAYKILTN